MTSLRLVNTRKLLMCDVVIISINLHLKFRLGGLIVSVLISGSSRSGSSPGRRHCVLFLGKTLYPQSASLHPGV